MKMFKGSLLQQSLTLCCLLCLTLLAGVALSANNSSTLLSKRSDKSLYFVLLTNSEHSEFWRLTEQAAQKAAKDLGIELQVISLNGNPLRPVRVLSALVNAPKKPNAVLFSNMKNTGKAVLEMLFRHIEYEIALSCRVRWTPGTAVFWDNRCTQHRAIWDYFPHSRYGERVTLVGEKPYI